MLKHDLQKYIHKEIPQSRFMEVVVENITEDSLSLSAPLEANINHKNSVFGGSISSVAILSAWTFLQNKVMACGVKATLVIHKNSMSYDIPILGKFTAVARFGENADWDKFLETLEIHGKARIEVVSDVFCDHDVAARLVGSFVALGEQ